MILAMMYIVYPIMKKTVIRKLTQDWVLYFLQWGILVNLKRILHRRVIMFVLLKMLHLVNVITVGNMLFGSEINWFIQLSRLTLKANQSCTGAPRYNQ